MKFFILTIISLAITSIVSAKGPINTIGIEPIALGTNDSTDNGFSTTQLAIDTIPNDSTESESKSNVNEVFDFDAEIERPSIPNKYIDLIRTHMTKLGESYLKQGYKVTSRRNGMVILISVPSDLLFNPNDTILSKSAKSQLIPILPLIKNNKDYKILLAVHCDNTGNAEFQSKLTEGRMYAIFNWFDANVSSKQSALLNGEYYGSEMPATYFDENDAECLIDNRSRENRMNNRRIEFYVIPNTELIQKVKGKKR